MQQTAVGILWLLIEFVVRYDKDEAGLSMDGMFQRTRNILAVEAVYRPGEKKSYRQVYEAGTNE